MQAQIMSNSSAGAYAVQHTHTHTPTLLPQFQLACMQCRESEFWREGVWHASKSRF